MTGDRVSNKETGRAATSAFFGIACYQGTFTGERFDGNHKGVVETWADAERWVDGDDTVPMIRVFPIPPMPA